MTGSVNQELLLPNEYLACGESDSAVKVTNRFRLTNPERTTLSEIAKRLGRKAVSEIATVAKSDTILGIESLWLRS